MNELYKNVFICSFCSRQKVKRRGRDTANRREGAVRPRSCLVSFQQFIRCPPPQTHQVVCPILALLRGPASPQGPSWAPALDRTLPQALFTV
ncbi:unnamed protein product [Pleuronectes platessa]|uniref:Uncharacterized protein n=1 Tax=Pleuronectes platessa TaxID=8262 RepID=A0A9N7THZ0_PLEPL|nr:unnamed protein product [Pleuronectes platessa]